MNAKISLIITADGSLRELNRALDSICGQSLQELEVICIDNGFDELSKKRIKRFSEHYDWIKLIPDFQGSNDISSKLAGASVASGEYIIFLDTNIFFETKALETLYEKAKGLNADILQFRLNALPQEGVTSGQINQFKSKQSLPLDILYEDEILKNGYLEHNFSLGLHDKIFRASALKVALEKLLKVSQTSCLEELLLFIVAAYSKVFCGENSTFNVKYMLYSDSPFLLDEACIQDIDRHIELMNSVCHFLQENCEMDESKEFVDQLHIDFLHKTLDIWTKFKSSDEQKMKAFSQLLKYWGAKDVICGLAQWHGNAKEEYLRLLPDVFSRQLLVKSNRNVAVFDDIELAERLSENAYNVVLFTDSSVSDDNATTNYTIIEFQTENNNSALWYSDRYEMLCNAIRNYDINICFFNMCGMQYIWEILTVKSCGTYAYINAEEVKTLSTNFRENDTNTYWNNLMLLIQADAVTLPFDADTTMFDKLGINILNPNLSIEDIFETITAKHCRCWDVETCLYEQKLLTEKYRQTSINIQRENSRYRTVVGPLRNVLFRQINISLVQKGIKSAILLEMLHEASLVGKAKLLIKTLLKMLGFNFKLGIQNYYPKAQIPFHNRMKKLGENLLCLFTNPHKFYKKLQAKKRWNLACEKRFSYGNKNPDKTFYLIRLQPGNEGILLSYLRYLRELKRLENLNYLPVIDMKWTFYINTHNSVKDKNKVNGWEMYFQPVSGYTLDEACCSSNVIRGQICYREQLDNYFRSNILRENTKEAEADFAEWCRLDHKYMKLQPALEMQFEQEYRNLIGDSRVIGVMVREGYASLDKLNYALIANHPVQPETEQVINDIKQWIKLWNCDKVFVSAEYQQTIDIMQAAFGDKLVFSQRKRKNFSADEPEGYQQKREKYYKKLSREQINRDYLKEVYLLSRCTCLAAGRASASIVAALWNNGKYEHRYIYDLGTYSVDTTKAMVTLEDKQ